MDTRDRIRVDTTLVLGDRVFGTLDPRFEPSTYHLGGWHQASRQWVLFKEDRDLGTQASLGVARTSEQLAELGFLRTIDLPDPHTAVYMIINEGSQERTIEVAPGTDPSRYASDDQLPGVGNGPQPGGC